MEILGSDETESNFAVLLPIQGLLPLSNIFVPLSVINTHFLLKIVLLH